MHITTPWKRLASRLLAPAVVLLALAVSAALPMAALAAPPSPQPGNSGQPTGPIIQAPVTPGPPTTVRAGLGLRLREGPSTSDRVILVLRNGETVYPAAGPVWRNGISWTYVFAYRGNWTYEGFVASQYLANYTPGTPEPEPGAAVVTARMGLRLRWGPGTWYAIYRTVPYGTTLQTTGVTQWSGGTQWTQVVYEGYTLWAASMYLRAK